MHSNLHRYHVCFACWAVAAAALIFFTRGTATLAADPDDPFAPGNKAESAKTAKAPAVGKLIDFKVSVKPQKARRGETVQLTIEGTPKQGYHTYPFTQRAPEQDIV